MENPKTALRTTEYGKLLLIENKENWIEILLHILHFILYFMDYSLTTHTRLLFNSLVHNIVPNLSCHPTFTLTTKQ